MVTSRDVAHVAGVSQATVSRVLQGSQAVSQGTRERVLEALERTGYVPNANARAMKTRRTGSVGAVVSRITNPFYPQVLEALTERLAEADARTVLWTGEPGEASAVEAIRGGLVDGVVFTSVTPGAAPLAEALGRDLPIVLLNRGVDGIACDQVTTENEAGGRTAARYFRQAGHDRVALIGGPQDTSTAREREAGFRAGAGDLPPEHVRHADFTHGGGYAAMAALLALSDPPTAVFCVNDLTAMGALDAARAAGVKVPEDCWVVGFDDIDLARWESFDLTTLRQPITEMVVTAVDLLLARLDDPARPPEHRRFPSRLIVRGSTAHTPLEEAEPWSS